MHLSDQLFGVTFECPERALNEKKRAVRCILEGKNYSSLEIDRIFSSAKARGESLYYVDEDVLHCIQPDVVFTQNVCEVCQIDTQCTMDAVSKLDNMPEVIAITPQSLQDVFDSAVRIAKAFNAEESAYEYLGTLNKRIDHITDGLRQHRVRPKRVMLMEWIEPIYNCGHWIPDQIAFAGGIDMMSNPCGDSIVTAWNKIVRYDPEVLVIAPCGFFVNRTVEEMGLLTAKEEWNDLTAVKQNSVYIANFDLFTQPSASTLVEGIELLATMFHPEIFKPMDRQLHHFQNFNYAK